MPTPARKRKRASDHTPVEAAASRVNTENQIMVSISVRARPKRSATGPQTSAMPHPIMKSAKSNPP